MKPLTVLVMALSMSAVAAAQEPRPAAPAVPTVVASGEGVVQAIPDRAWVMITAESRASNPREAQRRNAELMAPVQDKLRAAGVPSDAIRTIGYDLQQEWDYVSNRRVSRGFMARNTVEVRIDAIDRVGELLEIAVGSGATSVGGVRFDLKDRDKLEREAIRLAVADARAKAEAAAAGANTRVARIIRIDERGVSRPPMMDYAVAREAAVGQVASAPVVSAGQLEIRASVTVTAELQ
jgi:uncharacterized protein YggE